METCLRAASWCFAIGCPSAAAPPSRGTQVQRSMSKRHADMNPRPRAACASVLEPSHVMPRGCHAAGAAAPAVAGSGEPSTGAVVAIGTAQRPEKRHCAAAPPALRTCIGRWHERSAHFIVCQTHI